MAKTFLHLAITLKLDEKTSYRQEEIQKVLNKAADWLRYTSNCWIIYTGLSASTWNQRLRSIGWIIEEDPSYFICELSLRNRSGWLRRSIWNWITKTRSD